MEAAIPYRGGLRLPLSTRGAPVDLDAEPNSLLLVLRLTLLVRDGVVGRSDLGELDGKISRMFSRLILLGAARERRCSDDPECACVHVCVCVRVRECTC